MDGWTSTLWFITSMTRNVSTAGGGGGRALICLLAPELVGKCMIKCPKMIWFYPILRRSLGLGTFIAMQREREMREMRERERERERGGLDMLISAIGLAALRMTSTQIQNASEHGQPFVPLPLFVHIFSMKFYTPTLPVDCFTILKISILRKLSRECGKVV